MTADVGVMTFCFAFKAVCVALDCFVSVGGVVDITEFDHCFGDATDGARERRVC